MVIMIKIFIKKNIITLTLAILLLVLSVVSLFIGVIDINIKNLSLSTKEAVPHSSHPADDNSEVP